MYATMVFMQKWIRDFSYHESQSEGIRYELAIATIVL